MTATRCQYRWGRVVDPQVKKFEHVYSDDHQMSLAGVGMSGSMSRGGGCAQRSMTYGACDVTYLLTTMDRQMPVKRLPSHNYCSGW